MEAEHPDYDKVVARGMSNFILGFGYIEFSDGGNLVLPREAMYEAGLDPSIDATQIDTEDPAIEKLLGYAIDPTLN